MGLVISSVIFVGCGEEELSRLLPKISVDPESIELGETPVGVARRFTLTVENTGAGLLEVDNVFLLPPNPQGILSTDLSVSTSGTLPAEIDQAQTMEITLDHVPRDAELDAALIRITSNDGERAALDVPVDHRLTGAPEVAAVPNLEMADSEAGTPGGVQTTIQQVLFGFVAPGLRTVREIHVVNIGSGNAPLSIDRVAFVDATPSDVVLTVEPPIDERTHLPALGPDSRTATQRSIRVEIAWAPSGQGADLSAVLRIESNDAMTPVFDIPISGTTEQGAPPRIRLDPAAGLAFASVAVGMTDTITLRIHNDGASALEVQPLSFATNPDSVFAFTAATQMETIPSGGMRAYDVTFTPAAGQAYAGSIAIVSNDPTMGALSYPVNGGRMMCAPGTPDPGEPANDTCATAIDRGNVLLASNMTSVASWSDAQIESEMDSDWSRLTLSVDAGCTLVGYDLGARATLPGGEAAEVCVYMGDCGAFQSMRCQPGSARIFLFPGDAICGQFANQVPVYIEVRHTSGAPMCMPYTLNFDAR